jgi:hypothetical protein
VVATRQLVQCCTDHATIRRLVYRSFAEVYALAPTTSGLFDEAAPLAFEADAPAWLRERVEADLTVCAQLGGPLQIAVLRLAEVLARDNGSQLWDYLSSTCAGFISAPCSTEHALATTWATHPPTGSTGRARGGAPCSLGSRPRRPPRRDRRPRGADRSGHAVSFARSETPNACSRRATSSTAFSNP